MLISFDREEINYTIIGLELLLSYHNDPEAPKSNNITDLIKKLRYCEFQIRENGRAIPSNIGQMILKHPHLINQSESLDHFLNLIKEKIQENSDSEKGVKTT